jgi:hypothetical protein
LFFLVFFVISRYFLVFGWLGGCDRLSQLPDRLD